MALRFFQKKDGSKILQESSSGALNCTWKDIPLVKEETFLDQVMGGIYKFNRTHGHNPRALILGFVDYDIIKEEMDATYPPLRPLEPVPSRTYLALLGIPLVKHPAVPHGTFYAVDAK